MKITTKGLYGFHAMVELARREGQGPVMIRKMAEEHGISEKYLEQIMRLLRQAGLVESSRGAKGGFWLVRPAAEINALEILEALEGISERVVARLPELGPKKRSASVELWKESVVEAQAFWRCRSLADLVRLQDQLDLRSGREDYSI